MYKSIRVLRQLYIWQLTLIVGVSLLLLGFTGAIPFSDITLEPGLSEKAIGTGILFFMLGINIKLMSMLIERRIKDR